MTDLSVLINNEYKDVSFNIESAQIISVYHKQRRRRLAAFAGAAVCLIAAFGVFVQFNPKAVGQFVGATGNFLRNIFSGFESVELTAPTTAPSESALIVTEASESEVSKKAVTEKPKPSEYLNTPAPTRSEAKLPSAETSAQSVTEPASESEPQLSERSGVTSKNLVTVKVSYIKVSADTIRITKCVPTANKVFVPEKIDCYTVAEIGDSVLRGYTRVSEVYLPDSVTAIGANAFSGLSNLKFVYIPEGIKRIGDSAFENCASLEKISLYGVESIGSRAFMGCKGLKTIAVPAAAKTVGEKAFANCDGLESAVFASDCAGSGAGNNIFANCGSLTEVTVAEGVTSTFVGQFCSCSSLKKVALPSTLKAIGNSTFDGCTSLSEIKLPKYLEKIGQSAFRKCSSLSGISFPDSLRSIESRAFLGCAKLCEVTVSKNVKILGSMCLGYLSDESRLSGFLIKGYDNTVAKSYAEGNGISFVALGGKPNPTTVTLDKYIALLNIGEEYNIIYTVDKPNGETTFTSSDASVAEVDTGGVVKAVGEGKAAINVTNNGATRQLVVIVS